MDVLLAAAQQQGILFGLASVIALGVTAQWLAWRINVPSILLLLIFGFVAGPVLAVLAPNWALNPDQMLGPDLLLAFVSLSVGLILYEGGLSLNWREIREVRGVVRNLVTIGIVVTWLGSAVLAHFCIGMSWPTAMLLGSVLVVSGPTVIIPMLRYLRPKGRLASTIKWEGIVNDPIGALLAVLVFEVIVATSGEEAASAVAWGLTYTVVIGGGLGVTTALLLAWLVSRHGMPDHLHNAVSLMLVVATFVVSNLFQSESGLFAVTIMGIVLANQRIANVHHIVEFKEQLRVLLISTLFILLSARLTIDDLTQLGWGAAIFVIGLIVLVRPLAVLASTVGGPLRWRERALLAWMAPRGIVAAAVVSVFAIGLEARGVAGAELLTPITFLVIVATVAVYGLTAAPIARWLQVADPNPQGLLLIGAQRWSRQMAEALAKIDARVLLIDNNWSNTSAARMSGLTTHDGNILSDFIIDDLDLSGIGRALALTPNDEVNALALRRFERMFGKKEVYQLSPAKGRGGEKTLADEMHGRVLFGPKQTYQVLNQRVAAGAVFRATPLTEQFTYDDLRQKHGEDLMLLFIKRSSGSLVVITEARDAKPKAGDTVITLGPPDPKPAETSESDAPAAR